MTNVVRSSFQAASHELIAKLVKAGYLRPALCNDADAVTAPRVRDHKNPRESIHPNSDPSFFAIIVLA